MISVVKNFNADMISVVKNLKQEIISVVKELNTAQYAWCRDDTELYTY